MLAGHPETLWNCSALPKMDPSPHIHWGIYYYSGWDKHYMCLLLTWASLGDILQCFPPQSREYNWICPNSCVSCTYASTGRPAGRQDFWIFSHPWEHNALKHNGLAEYHETHKIPYMTSFLTLNSRSYLNLSRRYALNWWQQLEQSEIATGMLIFPSL